MRHADNRRNSVDDAWTEKKPRMNSRRLLRDSRGGRRNTFTVGNGHHPGATPGRRKGRETGISGGCLAPAGWRVAPGWPGNRPIWGDVAAQGPLHLIHEGGLVALCRTKRTHPRPTRRRAGANTRMLGAPRSRGPIQRDRRSDMLTVSGVITPETADIPAPTHAKIVYQVDYLALI